VTKNCGFRGGVGHEWGIGTPSRCKRKHHKNHGLKKKCGPPLRAGGSKHGRGLVKKEGGGNSSENFASFFLLQKMQIEIYYPIEISKSDI